MGGNELMALRFSESTSHIQKIRIYKRIFKRDVQVIFMWRLWSGGHARIGEPSVKDRLSSPTRSSPWRVGRVGTG